jgi:hypothetical protein
MKIDGRTLNAMEKQLKNDIRQKMEALKALRLLRIATEDTRRSSTEKPKGQPKK